VQDAPLNWYQYTIEGTRRFRALKLWLSWKHLGTEGFGRLVEHTNDLAAHMVRRCRELGVFELAPAELSVVCFRHVPDDVEDLDAYQDRLQRALEVDGTGWVSTTRLRGKTYLRAGIVNYLSTTDDVDAVLDALIRLSPVDG
jgi:glutamate/tyrosine decarboxylase-like PLP-dependent enzyme